MEKELQKTMEPQVAKTAEVEKDLASIDTETMLKKAPTLTLVPETQEALVEVKQLNKSAVAVPQQQVTTVPEYTFTPEEQRQVEDFSKKIELDNTSLIMQYGAGAQNKIASFSEAALNNVRNKDLGEVGDLLVDVVGELKNFQEDDEGKGGLFGLFKRTANKVLTLKEKYDKASGSVDKISRALEEHQIQLLKDVALLDKMYDLNKIYFKELNMYIAAGKKRLQIAQATELPKLMEKAQATGLPEDAQAVNDFNALINRFEKKIHDLELTRMVSIQMAPQMRLIQSNDTLMSEKIQSTLMNTIPLWKSQMVLALGVTHSQEAARAQREVTDLTNELLRKNAQTLKTATIETAKESERGLVDLATLQETNAALITTLDQVMQIQRDGRLKRAEAEKELARMEGELKSKLMELRS